jgi:tetratricopeptide (TPR) repeat protein
VQPPLETDLYKIDTKGDSANVTYGTSYRYSFPPFRRFGGGYILGLPGKWRIDRDKGQGKGLVLMIPGQDVDKRSRRGNMFAVDASRVGRLKSVEGVTKGFGPNDEFVAISGRTEEPVEEEVKVMEVDYRSLEGKAKATSPEDVESVSSDDDETFSYSEELRQRTINLDRKLQSDPHDIQTWLDFAALQDDIGTGQKASTAEIKMGILKKALDQNPGNTRLFVELFKLESVLWECLLFVGNANSRPKKVLSHWDEVLKKHQSTELLIEYLNYRQTSFVSFTYPEIVATYTQCLTTLRKSAWYAKTADRPSIERTILYVFQRFAHLAREAGYHELAIASFQALMELNLFRPQLPSFATERDQDVELDRFEDFWDSECLRFGEEGATGWNSFDPDISMAESPAVTDAEISGNSMDEWVRREESRKGEMPARTTDDLTEDDPYRVILFSDIRPFLYTFTTEVLRELPYAFLSFCGATLPQRDASSSDPLMTDVWLHNQFNLQGFWPPATNVEMIEWVNGEAVEPERLPGIDGPFTFKRNVWPVTFDTLFPSPDSWFQQLEKSNLLDVNAKFLSTALSQLKPIIQDEWLMIYHVAIENILSPSTVLKLAKSYLKTRKTSTSLWNVYALLLWRRNEYEEARKIWKTAIDMTFSTHVDPITLWRTWITAEFEVDLTKARGLLTHLSPERPDFGHNAVIGGAGEMKTRKYIQDQFDRAFSFKEWDSLEGFAFLGVLLEYLSSNLDAAIRKCKEYIIALGGRDLSGTIHEERILLSVSKILYHHTKIQGWYRSSTLRDFWLDAISTFPQNTAFLSLFTWNEANARIDGRVRKLLTSLEKTASADTWVFSIWAEMTIERGRVSEFGVRSLLEKAVESDK